MNAGRELDALIAEKVMGISVHNGWILEQRQIPCPDNRLGCLVCHYDDFPVRPKPYSTDIAAAWEVVERARHDGHNVNIQSFDEGDGLWWTVSIGEAMVDERNPCEAICLAALKTCGVEVDVNA